MGFSSTGADTFGSSMGVGGLLRTRCLIEECTGSDAADVEMFKTAPPSV